MGNDSDIACFRHIRGNRDSQPFRRLAMPCGRLTVHGHAGHIVKIHAFDCHRAARRDGDGRKRRDDGTRAETGDLAGRGDERFEAQALSFLSGCLGAEQAHEAGVVLIGVVQVAEKLPMDVEVEAVGDTEIEEILRGQSLLRHTGRAGKTIGDDGAVGEAVVLVGKLEALDARTLPHVERGPGEGAGKDGISDFVIVF